MNETLQPQEPDKKDWENLYRTAREFLLAAPWEWINSEELVAIENPLDGEVGFCSVLGAGRQEYGLGIYIGDAGYQAFMQLSSGKVEPEQFFDNVNFPMFSMLLVDRETLQKKDLEIIRSLKLQFRGKNAWPLFRSILPGYIPWFLFKDEALYLTDVMRQVLNIADRIKRNELDLAGKGSKNRVLTRCFREGQWIDEWRQPRPLARRSQTEEAIGAVKEAQLLLLKNSAGPLSGEWELDMFILPGPVKSDSGRPFYPICILAIDKKQGLILNTRLLEPDLTPQNKQDELIRILKETRPMPATIWINSQPVKALLKPVAESLGINLKSGPQPMLAEAKKALIERFS
jgi:hypothetical protein